jgi:CheY-like chemotaxis protein
MLCGGRAAPGTRPASVTLGAMDAAGAERASDRRLRILLVDDDPESVELYRIQLEFDGHELSIAHDGEQGLALASEELPDLAIVEAQMPGSGGLELIERLRAQPATASLPVLVLSTYADIEVVGADGPSIGALAWLVKLDTPPSELSQWIRDWAAGRRVERAEP